MIDYKDIWCDGCLCKKREMCLLYKRFQRRAARGKDMLTVHVLAESCIEKGYEEFLNIE